MIVKCGREIMNRSTERDDPARTLAQVDHLMRRGAEISRLRFPSWYLVSTCLLSTAFGAANDIPSDALHDSGWLVRQLLVWTLLVLWVVLSRVAWRGARPRARVYGRLLTTILLVSIVTLYIAATGLGLGLRASGVPLAFMWAGLTFGVVLTTGIRLSMRQISDRYHENLKRGHW